MTISNVKILGIKISILNSYKAAYTVLLRRIKSVSYSDYITVNNVHTVVEGVLNKDYREALNNSFLALPDGKPLSIVAKLKGHKNMGRIFGPTFMEKTIDWGRQDNLKHFFFGSSEDTLEKLQRVIKLKYSGATIVGAISPPYKEKFTEEENDEFINIMNESGADIFWIGLGAPKQEIWMYKNYKKLNRGVMIGIGAGFDYLAGNTKHAPQWMKKFAFEWLYRLIQEPGRLYL